MSNEPEEVTGMRDLPDLPELESVEAKTEDTRPANIALTIVVMVLITVASAFPVAAIVSSWKDVMGRNTEIATGMVCFLLILALIDYWFLSSLLTRQYHWKTDAKGLTVGRLFRKRFLAWDDIRDAELLTKGRKPVLNIIAGSRRLTLSTAALRYVSLYLSIRQHLRRRGLAEKLPFPPEAVALWHAVPEEVPEEMEWENPQPPSLLEAVMRLTGWAAIIWIIALRLSSENGAFGIAAGLTVVVIRFCWMAVIVFRRFSVRRDNFHADRLVGSVEGHWSTVRRVEFFVGVGSMPPSIVLTVGWLRAVRIPWYPRHPNSTRLILATLRRLREEGHLGPVPVPTILVEAMAQGGAAVWNASRR